MFCHCYKRGLQRAEQSIQILNELSRNAVSVDNFCRSRKLSSALREESRGKERGRKIKEGEL